MQHTSVAFMWLNWIEWMNVDQLLRVYALIGINSNVFLNSSVCVRLLLLLLLLLLLQVSNQPSSWSSFIYSLIRCLFIIFIIFISVQRLVYLSFQIPNNNLCTNKLIKWNEIKFSWFPLNISHFKTMFN